MITDIDTVTDLRDLLLNKMLKSFYPDDDYAGFVKGNHKQVMAIDHDIDMFCVEFREKIINSFFSNLFKLLEKNGSLTYEMLDAERNRLSDELCKKLEEAIEDCNVIASAHVLPEGRC